MHFWSATPQFGRGGCGRRRPGTSGTLYIGGAGLNRNKRLGMQNNPYAIGSSFSHRQPSSAGTSSSSSNGRFNQSGANNTADEESRSTTAGESSRGTSFYPTNATRSSREYPQEIDIGLPSSSNAERMINNTANNNGELSSTNISEFQQFSPISPSIDNADADPKWIRTKRIGLSLFFLSFILLGIVAAKFIIEGPILIDTARKGKSESTIYFFLTELIFVALAFVSFFTGIYCLRKQTNKYLLRQFNQHILQTSNNPVASNLADDSTFSSSTNVNYQSEIFFNDDESDLQPPGYQCHPQSLTPCLYHHSPTRGGRNHSGHHLHNFIVYGQRQSRCPYLASQKPPPSYDVALNLPLPINQNNISYNSAGQVLDSSITTTNINCTSIEIDNENKETTIMNKKDDTNSSPVPIPKSETPPPEYKKAFEEFRFKI